MQLTNPKVAQLDASVVWNGLEGGTFRLCKDASVPGIIGFNIIPLLCIGFPRLEIELVDLKRHATSKDGGQIGTYIHLTHPPVCPERSDKRSPCNHGMRVYAVWFVPPTAICPVGSRKGVREQLPRFRRLSEEMHLNVGGR